MLLPFAFSPKLIILSVITAIALTLGGVGYFKYTSMVSTIEKQATQIEELTNSYNGCKTSITSLEYGIDQQNMGIEELRVKNATLAEEVEASKVRIRTIRNQRDKALDNLGKIPVPVSCEAKFDWLIERAQEISK